MRIPGIVILLLILTSCSSAPPVPTDRFYRLSAPQGENQSLATEHIIYVGPIIAEGLYNERALLYTGESGATELQQYHYHFWITSPPRLLQDQLISFLRASNTASMIIDEPGSGEKISIFGKLKSFERINIGEESSVSVILELKVQEKGKQVPVLLKEYSVTERLDGKSVPQTVAAFDRAVMEMYSDFISDLLVSL